MKCRGAGAPSPEVLSTLGAASTSLLPKALLPKAHHRGCHPRASAGSAAPARFGSCTRLLCPGLALWLRVPVTSLLSG